MNILLFSLPHFTSFHDSHSLCQYLRRRAIYYKIIDEPQRKKRKKNRQFHGASIESFVENGSHCNRFNSSFSFTYQPFVQSEREREGEKKQISTTKETI